MIVPIVFVGFSKYITDCVDSLILIILVAPPLFLVFSEIQRRDIARQRAEEKLSRQAMYDELTGLPNRRLLADRLNHTLAMARRQGINVGILYIDLDGFKLVNDSLGHSVGDLLLEQVAERLRSRIRESDTLARLGGDEFTVVLSQLRERQDAESVARQLIDQLSMPFHLGEHAVTISGSVGISVFPEHGSEPESLLQHADSAMYHAKRQGKNRMNFYSPDLGEAVRERMNLERQLRGAIGRGEIKVHYQPEFDLSGKRLTRFEALARWIHPTLGTIQPDVFIPIAEGSGVIVSLGAYVMEQACLEAKRWQNASANPIQVAVNVSSLEFSRSTFVKQVQEILTRTGLAPTLLQIEITESAMISGMSYAAKTIDELRNLGISVAIDDFGTGYSCLSYLPQLSFDVLKVDRTFVKELENNPEKQDLVRALISIAHSFGMRVIAEGIENDAQMQRIKDLGGDEAQGYLLGRPIPDPLAKLPHLIQRETTGVSTPETMEITSK
jgi:diguanylate cyclase (GGDEF)-like protein